ncbi:peptide chain release factor 3 [Polyangium sp. y55x31]|uniref:peptide chain release factor 3 n=1 Tax=Polyangium sp. y55x31 TaxID=3042688 RepID=UPI0024824D81|nr:peptide chain release factor 3 [Polyangium sp. y55x31]MDI1476640.1 peptide chain release factor 3 [Polyangium sp. y55x31]
MSDPQLLQREIARRKTFAIISHPDAGKTTLTEKLLLYGGAIQLAGAVKAKRARAHAVSDYLEMERERGISIQSSVLQFPYKGRLLSLVDTPGHADFSEDTYRALMATDAAIMLLDSAKGVEAQTKKLFRVCKLRSMPIFSFVNKMDRPGRDPFELIGEVEEVLGIGVYPITWPITVRGQFKGVYHRVLRQVFLFQQVAHGAEIAPMQAHDLYAPELEQAVEEEGVKQLREDVELLDAAGDALDMGKLARGEVTPMFFGSALTNFGLPQLLDSFVEMMPQPAPRASDKGAITPDDERFTAFVFKIQANMDRAHRDRIAFVRVCSGRYERGMKVRHVRLDRDIRLTNPVQFLAQERTVVDDGFAGDIIGVFDPGIFLIGDTLTDGANVKYAPLPQFPPEHFGRVVMVDPMKRKQLKKGLEQLAQEGSVQLFRPPEGREGESILGAVGELQFDVVKHRLLNEYGADVRIERLSWNIARWVEGEPVPLAELESQLYGYGALDVHGQPVVLFKGDWQLETCAKAFPKTRFVELGAGALKLPTAD